MTESFTDGLQSLAVAPPEYDGFMAKRAHEAARPKTDQPKTGTPLRIGVTPIEHPNEAMAEPIAALAECSSDVGKQGTSSPRVTSVVEMPIHKLEYEESNRGGQCNSHEEECEVSI